MTRIWRSGCKVLPGNHTDNTKVAKAFDGQILDVIGGKQKNRCKQTTAAFLWQGHNLLIEVAIPYQMITTAPRQIARSVSIKHMFIEVWHKRNVSKKWQDRGIVACMVRQITML